MKQEYKDGGEDGYLHSDIVTKPTTTTSVMRKEKPPCSVVWVSQEDWTASLWRCSMNTWRLTSSVKITSIPAAISWALLYVADGFSFASRNLACSSSLSSTNILIKHSAPQFYFTFWYRRHGWTVFDLVWGWGATGCMGFPRFECSGVGMRV